MSTCRARRRFFTATGARAKPTSSGSPSRSRATRRSGSSADVPRRNRPDRLRLGLLETKNDIDRRGKHRVVARVIEWPGIAEGMIDAQLGTNDQARERFRARRLDVETDRETAISGPATAD